MPKLTKKPEKTETAVVKTEWEKPDPFRMHCFSPDSLSTHFSEDSIAVILIDANHFDGSVIGTPAAKVKLSIRQANYLRERIEEFLAFAKAKAK